MRRLKPRKNTLGHGWRPDDVFEEDFFFFFERTGAPRCFQIRLNIKTESLANLRLMKAAFVSWVFKAGRNKVTVQIYAQTMDKHCCWHWRKVLCLSSPSLAAVLQVILTIPQKAARKLLKSSHIFWFCWQKFSLRLILKKELSLLSIINGLICQLIKLALLGIESTKET